MQTATEQRPPLHEAVPWAREHATHSERSHPKFGSLIDTHRPSHAFESALQAEDASWSAVTAASPVGVPAASDMPGGDDAPGMVDEESGSDAAPASMSPTTAVRLSRMALQPLKLYATSASATAAERARKPLAGVPKAFTTRPER